MSEQQQINNLSRHEAYKFLKLMPNPDGSVTRLGRVQNRVATPEYDAANPSTHLALSKDITLNSTTNTFIRLFRPQNIPPKTKIPLIIYFHGGGFVLSSATSTLYHDSSCRTAAHIPAIIASVNYRLAPEHRLPSAFEDGMDAVMWAKTQALSSCDHDEWMKEHADFSKVFLMGISVGGTIVYHVGLRALDFNLQPMKIIGLIMNQPSFGGLRRTQSELKYFNDPVTPLHVVDLLWSLALPKGADRDHEYCNLEEVSKSRCENIGRFPVCMVRGYNHDPFVDRQKDLLKMLEARGVRVVSRFRDGGYHAADLFNPQFAQLMHDDIKYFINSVVDGLLFSKL
ncbi:hypothetical protein ACJIZ3_023277 [Penstemon smallii]|uniref:Alpha/beta hydrolase fold-3 domain-containing protein n=1 Tax=Penstemon smallii TaxID=265156 RepID=A0ABD3TNM8_9LAMI